jgi:hypothetical protein
MKCAPLLVLFMLTHAGMASAQTEVRPPRELVGAAASKATEKSERAARERAVADCESIWDAGTHMTRQEWSRTCRRVQNRLNQVDAR